MTTSRRLPHRARPARRILASVVGVGMLLAGCAPPQDELAELALADAAARFGEEAFGFRLDVDASDEAIEALGEATGPLGLLVSSIAVRGVSDQDRLSISAELLGVEVLSARTLGDGTVYVRFDGQALAVLGGDPAGGLGVGAEVAAQLRRQQVPDDVIVAVVAAAEGSWVAIGGLEADEADGGDGVSALGAALARVLAGVTITGQLGELREGDPADVLLDVVVSPQDALDAAITAAAGLDPTGALAQDISAAPVPVATDAVDGSMLLAQGRVVELAVDIGDALQGVLGAQPLPGTYLLTLELVGPEKVLPIERPVVAATLTLEQLQTAIDAVGTLSAP